YRAVRLRKLMWLLRCRQLICIATHRLPTAIILQICLTSRFSPILFRRAISARGSLRTWICKPLIRVFNRRKLSSNRAKRTFFPTYRRQPVLRNRAYLQLSASDVVLLLINLIWGYPLPGKRISGVVWQAVIAQSLPIFCRRKQLQTLFRHRLSPRSQTFITVCWRWISSWPSRRKPFRTGFLRWRP